MLLLTALWPLGSSAGDAGQASAALPASGPVKAARLPTAAMPAPLQGQWTPISKSLASAGPLTLGAQALHWSICGKSERLIKPQVTNGGQQALIDLTVDGAPPCNLDGQHVTYLHLKQGSLTKPGNVCEIEATLYGHGPQPVRSELLGWGVFTNERCPTVQAP
jgi:hypothetical protein